MADTLRTTPSELYKLERGERRLTDVWARRLATVYEVAPADLFSEDGLSIVIKHICARRGQNDRSLSDRGTATGERYVQAPEFVMRPEETFGFEILDRHAEGLNYPPGTRGLGRPLAYLGRKLKRGDRVVALHFAGTRAAGELAETLVGLLDRAVNGDLLLLALSATAAAAAPVLIRRARRDEPPASGDEIDYTPRDDDFAEILGVPVAAVIPQ